MTIINDIKNATHFGIESENEDNNSSSVGIIIWNEIVNIDVNNTAVNNVKKIKLKIKISATDLLTENNFHVLNFLIYKKPHYTNCIQLVSKNLLMDEDIVQYIEIEALITEIYEENCGGSKYNALMTFLTPFAAQNISNYKQGTQWDCLQNKLINFNGTEQFNLNFFHKALFDLNIVEENQFFSDYFQLKFNNGELPEFD